MDERLSTLIIRATAADGTPPFSDGALVELALGERGEFWIGDAVALRTHTAAEFVVDPDARRQGQGTRMLDALISESPSDLLIWAHGDHPGSRALATRFRLERVRELLHLEAEVRPPYAPQTTRPFDAADAAAWVALNARAFAAHPEQGAVTRRDLDVLQRKAWFNPNDFLLLEDDGELIGYCWLKVEGDSGEFYVVGVSPDRQGEGWGRLLMHAGMARLASRGIRTAHLYVEGDNAPALALYASFGFTRRSIDVQYKTS
jgi:mycothiol synthase